jgi:UDP-GlcNAc:undecaprenyl-phosphate/decaprenyl-phosphate GlcNAc-1-phosphate transferase
LAGVDHDDRRPLITELPPAAVAAASFALALTLTLLLTPLARRMAITLAFLDHPIGYKGHAVPTPYLGGCAVIAAIVVAWLLAAADAPGFATLLGGAALLAAVGTLDDRVGLPITPRLVAQIAVASSLFVADLGWHAFSSDALNYALTLVWVVGIVNAFNLMDNLDGAAASVAASSALGAGVLAAANGNPALGAIAFALAGGCVGFLPFNLARPSQIFFGDGGSTPIGLVLATVVMALPDSGLGWAAPLALAPLVGLPILDTALVVRSRVCRGVPILSGGRDHLTHRLLSAQGSARTVAATVAAIQIGLALVAITLYGFDAEFVAAAAIAYVAAGLVTIVLIDGWPGRVPGMVTATQDDTPG